MKRKDPFLLHLLPMTLAAALAAAPALAQSSGSTTGTTMPGSTTSTTSTTMPGSTTTAAPASSATITTTTTGASSASSVTMNRPRVSQLIGITIYNDRNETIGEVDDIILAAPAGMVTGTTAMQGPMAVIQVGGFLGMGGRLVAVPLSELQWSAERERIVMPNASKETLQGRPVFSYETLRRG
jgi:sporulation protein YlmC with PRC-barrel domain